MKHKEECVATGFSHAKSSPEETTMFMRAAPVRSTLIGTTVHITTHKQKSGDELLNPFKT